MPNKRPSLPPPGPDNFIEMGSLSPYILIPFMVFAIILVGVFIRLLISGG